MCALFMLQLELILPVALLCIHDNLGYDAVSNQRSMIRCCVIYDNPFPMLLSLSQGPFDILNIQL